MSEKVKLHDKTFHVFISYEHILAAINQVATRINKDYAGKTPLFLGILNGSFMFMADLMKSIDIPCLLSFIKMNSYHGTGSSGEVTELIGLKEDLTGKHVIIVEDIVDTGLTLERLLQTLHAKGPASVEVATLLYKPAAYQKKFPVKYVGIETGNEFLVGYGLDYDGLGRNLKDIYRID